LEAIPFNNILCSMTNYAHDSL